jgi:hypothetical protein
MGIGWKTAQWLWGGFCALVLFAASVPAKEAATKLASWADLLGLVDLANTLSSKGVDRGAAAFSIVGFCYMAYDIYCAYDTLEKLRDVKSGLEKLLELTRKRQGSG